MILIRPGLWLNPNDLEENFIRSSGPGGQNVNKVSTAVELRFDTLKADFPADMQERLAKLAGRQMTQAGVLVLTTQSFRTQERNRQVALEKLIALLRKAAIRPRLRIATRPTKSSKIRRLETKSKQSRTKTLRRQKPEMD